MRNETKFVIGYFQQNAEFLEAIKVLSTDEKIQFVKKNIEPDVNAQLTQVQCNLFPAAVDNIE